MEQTRRQNYVVHMGAEVVYLNREQKMRSTRGSNPQPSARLQRVEG